MNSSAVASRTCKTASSGGAAGQMKEVDAGSCHLRLACKTPLSSSGTQLPARHSDFGAALGQGAADSAEQGALESWCYPCCAADDGDIARSR